MTQIYYKSPVGLINIKHTEKGIYSLTFEAKEIKNINYSSNLPLILKTCIDQLNAYFQGTLKRFDLTLDLEKQGTEFQRLVWKNLIQIGYATTVSYKDLAQKIDRPKAYRAVGSANGANPFSIIVPCHRVIQNNGNIGGYGGEVWRKKWLLEHELKYDSSIN